MNSFLRSSRGGFSLMELLVVLALMGVLAGLLLPALGSVQERARKSAAAHQMRQLTLAYLSLPAAVQAEMGRVESLPAWALLLARHAGVLEPDIYWVKGDILTARQNRAQPRQIGWIENGEWQLDRAFAEWPMAIAVAAGVTSERCPSHTPVLWTRGLRSDGSWGGEEDSDPGVFGREGGFVAYLDGRVVFYENLSHHGGQLRHYQTHALTGDIHEAIPPFANLLRQNVAR